MQERDRDACPKCAHTDLTLLYDPGPPELLRVTCATCGYHCCRPCADDDGDPIDKIQRFVCRHYGVPKPALLSRDRHKTVVEARQVAAYLARSYVSPAPSYPELGRRFGNRGHTTLMTAVKRGEAVVAAKPHLVSLFHGSSDDRQLDLPGIAETSPAALRTRVA